MRATLNTACKVEASAYIIIYYDYGTKIAAVLFINDFFLSVPKLQLEDFMSVFFSYAILLEENDKKTK